MPKRSNESSLEYIAQKLRKLEKEVKRSRNSRSRNCLSSSSSGSSSSSSSQSSNSSREPSPNPVCLEDVTIPDVQGDAISTEPPPPESNDTSQIVISDNSQEDIVAPAGNENDKSAEILDILGEDPSVTIEYGPDINKDVATRFTHIATSGLNKDVRKDLIKKYLVPSNCTNIAAPQLNAEFKAATTEQVVKRDKAIETRQIQMAAGLSCLGKIISNQLNAGERNNDLIKDLMDVGRIFCDIQHSESEARRNFALYSVKKELKTQLATTKIDKYLFGNNLTETLKTAKAVSKSSSDLKSDAPKKPKVPTATNTSSKNLNWKARAPPRRQPTGPPPPRQQLPATKNAPPRTNSSHNYTQRHKQSRRQ